MRRVAVTTLAGVALVAGGCGNGEQTIDTRAALAVFRSVGFKNLAVFPGKATGVEEARRLFRPKLVEIAHVDLIYTRGYAFVTTPLTATRLETVRDAKRRVAGDRPLLQGKLSSSERAFLPRDFEFDRLREVRVCNVVMTSYDSGRDPTLRARFDHAVKALRKKC